jgi:hypothetical protein
MNETFVVAVVNAVLTLVIGLLLAWYNNKNSQAIEQLKDYQSRARLVYEKRWEAREELLKIYGPQLSHIKWRFLDEIREPEMMADSGKAIEADQTSEQIV